MEDSLWHAADQANMKVSQMVLILVVMEDSLWPNERAVETLKHLVLILVVMEDSLWLDYIIKDCIANAVLILVVMEDSLWLDQACESNLKVEFVLILVVMEDSLWPVKVVIGGSMALRGLNPCCNGR